MASHLRNPLGHPGDRYDMNILEQLDDLITQRRIRSIYHQNVDLPFRSPENHTEMMTLSHRVDTFLEEEDWWLDFVNNDLVIESRPAQSPQPAVADKCQSAEDLSRETNSPRATSQKPTLELQLAQLFQSLPSCSPCRDQRIKCRLGESGCRECSRTSRTCTIYDPLLKENVPFA